MIKIFQNPIVVMTIALLSGVAGGVAPLWRAGLAIVTQIRAAHPSKAAVAKTQGWDFWTIEIDNLASELKEEKARQSKQGEMLDQRAARISADQQELEKLRSSLEAMRKEISEKVIEINTDEAKNVRSLSQTYASLSPRAAVAIIKELDDVTAVKILSLMKPDVVGPIFEEMSKTAGPDGSLARRAAMLSEKIRLMKAARTSSPS